MEPPILRDKTGKSGLPKFVIALIAIGALLFVAAGAVALYAAYKYDQAVSETMKDIGQD